MIHRLNETYVVGISERTTNADELAGGDRARIPGLWQRFFAENVADRIPNRLVIGQTAVLYTDYESDETGPYRIVIGAIVRDLSEIPPGMVGRTAPAGDYEKITTARGPLVEVTVATWQNIWNDAELRARRRFQGDLEIYDERSVDPANAELDILIGLK